MTRARVLVVVLSALGALGCGSDPSGGPGSDPCFESTYAAIQRTIFEAKGCTASVCHGESAEGGLDLRADVSHASLVYAPSSIDARMHRVQPGDQDQSLLYRKLQAKIQGEDLGELGQAMPLNTDPLTTDELEALRLWIRGGASPDAVVASTKELLGCDGTFDPDPNNIQPPPPPPVTCHDVNGDGENDILLTSTAHVREDEEGTRASALRVLLNVGSGVFVDATARRVPNAVHSGDDFRAHSMILGDLDGDEDLDLLLSTILPETSPLRVLIFR